MVPRLRVAQVRGLATVFVAAVGGIVLLTGCGGTSKVSAASLHSRLAPESVAPGFHLERTLDLTDPVNLVVEGIHLPERTHPSQAVSEVTSSGFEGAAGEDRK